MKRTGFARKTYTPPPAAPLRALTRPVNYGVADDRANCRPKERPVVSEAYRDLVRAMPCMHCGRPPRSQFCHADQSKGMGMKTDDRRGWPGCGPDLATGQPGCHWLIGTSGRIPKEQRRELEALYGAQTRTVIIEAGKWPKNLPPWRET